MVICMVWKPTLRFSTEIASSGNLTEIHTFAAMESEMAQERDERNSDVQSE